MGLFDILKRKKKKKEEPAKKPEKKPEKKKEQPKVSRPSRPGLAYRVLASPHVTEKATRLSESNQYIFKVLPKSNKTEIKKAIESLYGINVEKVRIINIHKKKRRTGRRREGWKKGYKKAIVEVKRGQKIEIMPR